MIKKNTLILLIIFIVLVTGYIVLDRQGWIDVFTSKEATTVPEANWISIGSDTITSITFQDEDNDVTIIVNENNGNWVTEETGIKIEAGAIERLFSELNAIIPLAIFDQSPDPEATGLLVPETTINLNSVDSRTQIKFGLLNPLQTGYYAQIDSGEVVLINKGSYQNFLSVLEEIQLSLSE